MIRRVRGTLLARTGETVEVLTRAGLSYEIYIPLGLLDRLPAAGEEVELHTVLVVRDDAMDLYGFESARDRELFRRLRTVSGVGPRLALAILGALPGARIVRAIRARDHASLQTVSGVGRKTAERITIELADKLDDLGEGPLERPVSAGASAAIQALRSLGYGQLESDEAVRRAIRSLDGRDTGTEELVRHALQFV